MEESEESEYGAEAKSGRTDGNASRALQRQKSARVSYATCWRAITSVDKATRIDNATKPWRQRRWATE